MTQAGLNTVDMSSLNTFQQVLILLLVVAGNQIVISIIVIYVRKRAFEERFKEEEKKRANQPVISSTGSSRNTIVYAPEDNGGRGVSTGLITGTHNAISIIIQKRERCGRTHVDRNSQFHSLSIEERQYVRCVEYQAVKLLGYVIPAYYMIWMLLGCFAMGSYISLNSPSVASDNSLHPWWVGVYLAVAAFNNAGISLLDSSVAPFERSPFVLICLSILMLAGNTAFPLFLRWILRLTLNWLPDEKKYRDWRDTINFILQYPRRVYTNLFPSGQTWWLFGLLIFFNATDWAAFEILNHFSPAVTAIPMGSRLLVGLFQTLSIRSSGFVVVPISSLFIGLQALYILMMYISAFPVTIAMRNSNVYEERSLGIYASDTVKPIDPEKNDDFSDFPSRQRDRLYFVQEQLRRQLGHDMWFLVISTLVIICIESGNFERDPRTFAIFNVIFEIVSAYGCVGFSVGLPDRSYSFCGAWHVLSRLILCAVMLRGRHRGLPFAIDKAIQLPSDKTDIAEEQDHQIRYVSVYHVET
ncbi:hypothetical protein K3495_g7675 [Podosphaera aphanis]|nr:hypothetical protein K3495_g7675 [Podosphaera aphanis]